jgi:triphosphoribosyl-dephospho-CoA synthase
MNGGSESHARIDALMAIMTSLTDTCVLSRAGMEGLEAMQHGARAVLTAGAVRPRKDSRRSTSWIVKCWR